MDKEKLKDKDLEKVVGGNANNYSSWEEETIFHHDEEHPGGLLGPLECAHERRISGNHLGKTITCDVCNFPMIGFKYNKVNE